VRHRQEVVGGLQRDRIADDERLDALVRGVVAVDQQRLEGLGQRSAVVAPRARVRRQQAADEVALRQDAGEPAALAEHGEVARAGPPDQLGRLGHAGVHPDGDRVGRHDVADAACGGGAVGAGADRRTTDRLVVHRLEREPGRRIARAQDRDEQVAVHADARQPAAGLDVDATAERRGYRLEAFSRPQPRGFQPCQPAIGGLVALAARVLGVGEHVVDFAREEQLHRAALLLADVEPVDEPDDAPVVPQAPIEAAGEVGLLMVGVRLARHDGGGLEPRERVDQRLARRGRIPAVDAEHVVDREGGVHDEPCAARAGPEDLPLGVAELLGQAAHGGEGQLEPRLGRRGRDAALRFAQAALARLDGEHVQDGRQPPLRCVPADQRDLLLPGAHAHVQQRQRLAGRHARGENLVRQRAGERHERQMLGQQVEQRDLRQVEAPQVEVDPGRLAAQALGQCGGEHVPRQVRWARVEVQVRVDEPRQHGGRAVFAPLHELAERRPEELLLDLLAGCRGDRHRPASRRRLPDVVSLLRISGSSGSRGVVRVLAHGRADAWARRCAHGPAATVCGP